MKVEDCTVSVERRSIGGCIDLAIVFIRQFPGPIIKLTLLFAVPSLLLTWWYSQTVAVHVLPSLTLLLPSIGIFMFFNACAGSVIVSAVGPQVFGVPMSVSGALGGLRQRIWAWAMMMGLTRLLQATTGWCILVPAIIATAYFGHVPEVLLLERTPLGQVTQRLSWLGKGGGMARNIGRIICLAGLWALLGIGIFQSLDLLSNLLFNAPIFLGTIGYGPDVWDALIARLFDDPVMMVALQTSLWIPYPMIRVAWFFCYLDQRIRNECWDLELQYRTEAIRLEEQPA